MKIRFDTACRRAVALLAAAALALPGLGVGTAQAASPASPPAAGPGVDVLCISGSIISHDEKPLGDGWNITATPVDENGVPTGQSLTTTSDGAGFFQFENSVTPGRWVIELDLSSVPGEWEPVTPERFEVQVAYGRKACLSVRFKLRLLIAVDVIKIDDNHNVLEGWTIIATPGKGNHFALPQQAVTDSSGVASLLLTAGKWVLSEVAPPGVTYTAVMPPGNLEVELDAAAQQPYVFRFKNRIHLYGCIVVTKFDQPPQGQAFPLPGWGVTVYRANGTVAAFGKTDQNGTVTFGALPLGPYTVVEEQRVGWKPASPSHVAVTLSDDACQDISFVNEQDPPGYSIIGYKLDSNGLAGLPGWTVSATPLDPTGYQPDAVVTDGTGRYQFIFPTDDYRVPGARYRVCEEMQAGWKPASPFCYEVTLPTKPGAPVIARPFKNRQVGHWESKHPACSKMHLIKAKNTWRSVARMYHKSVRALMKANPDIKSRGSLKKYAGLSLCIP